MNPARRNRRRTRLSKALSTLLAGTLLVGVVGGAMHPRLLLLLPALLALLAIGVAWPWLTVLLTPARLRFEHERVQVGQTLPATLQIRNRVPWPAWGLLLRLGPASRQLLRPVAPASRASHDLTLIPQTRGVFPSEPPRLSCGFPFGLITASRAIVSDGELVVWPQIFPVGALPAWATTDHTCGHVETRRLGSEGDTVGVREYRRGDPMRWIHWPQTARHERFMVREFQASGIPRVRIVLDCHPHSHVGTGTDGSFEWAVRIAASLASGWLHDGAEVELVAGPLRIAVAGGPAQRRAILDALATVQLEETENAAPADGHLATLLITTDHGWNEQVAAGSQRRGGIVLRSGGFGGDPSPALRSAEYAQVIARPEDVPAALHGGTRGLADVA